jgi:DNA-binding CsgD family transcriptional regulator
VPTADDLVDLFYQAALDAELWPLALARLADAVGGEGVALTYQHQESGAGGAIIARLDPAIAEPYFGYFATRNPIRAQNDLESVRERGPGVGPDHAHIPRAELERTEYFNDFMVPFGINSILMAGLAVHDMNVAVINIMRPKSKAVFDTEEVSFTRSIQGHLIRAFELSRRLGQARKDNETISTLLARSPHGVFLLHGDGRVHFANAVGEAMIAAGDGLRLEDGVLVSARPEVAPGLAALIGKTAQEPAEGGAAMLLPRRSGRRPYSLIATRVQSAVQSIFAGGPSVVACVTDPDGEALLPEARLKELFGLTPAETRVASGIVAGYEAKAIARTLGLSVNTVRVHTARIFAKTQTSRQAELVRLMMQLSGAYPG